MSQSQLARSAGLVMALIMFSRLLGFVRERAVAEVFGRNWQTDAFRAAFNIPDLMYTLLVGGAISAAFLPVFTEYLAKDREEEAWQLAHTFLTAGCAFLVVVAAAGAVFSPWLAPLVAYGFDGEQAALLVFLMRMMFPAVFFTALAGMAMGIHNAYRRFAIPLLGPIFYNVAIILGAYGLGPRMGITGMAVGTIIGAVGNFLIQLPFVWRQASRYPWRLHWRHPGLSRIAGMMGPALVGLAIFQINIIILTNLASGLDEGSITALNLANRLMQLPLGVFGMGLGIVLFPTLTRLAAQNRWDAFKSAFSFGMRGVMFVTIPSAAGLLALGEPVVRLLFEAGEFGSDDTTATTRALVFFAAGVVGLSGVQIVTRTFYALHDTRTPVKTGAAAVLVNTLLAVILLRFTGLGHGGLALAFTASSLTQLLLGLLLLRRKIGPFEGRRIAGSALRAAAAAAVMAAGAFLTAQAAALYVDLNLWPGRLVQVLAGISAGAIIYGTISAALRLEEMSFVRRLLRRQPLEDGNERAAPLPVAAAEHRSRFPRRTEHGQQPPVEADPTGITPGEDEPRARDEHEGVRTDGTGE